MAVISVKVEVRDLAALKSSLSELASVRSEVMQLKVGLCPPLPVSLQLISLLCFAQIKLSNVPLEVFPKTSIQTVGAGARAGLTGLSERIKHSKIAHSGSVDSDEGALLAHSSGDERRGDVPAPASVSGSLPPIRSPENRVPLEVSSLVSTEVSEGAFDLSSDSDSASRNEDVGETSAKSKAGSVGVAAVDVVTATVSTIYDESSESDSSFEKSELEDSAAPQDDGGSSKQAMVAALCPGGDLEVMAGEDDDVLDEDDGSVQSRESMVDMRETSRIMEDSLDESIHTFDEEHKRILQAQVAVSKESEVVLPPSVATARPSRTAVKITSSSKYETHKRSPGDAPSGAPTSGEPLGDEKPSSEASQKSPAAVVQPSEPKLQVDSLGNIVSNRPKATAVSSAGTTGAAVAAGGAPAEDGSKLKGPSAAILSGSLLGSGGRNKSVPVPK